MFQEQVKMNDLMLISPSKEYAKEIIAYRQEYITYGSIFNGAGGLEMYDDPIKWIEHCRSVENKETLPGPDWVTASQFMLLRATDSKIIGMISIRHYFNDHLAEYGGHIGYSVLPSERRKGYGKRMMLMCLDKCREIGLKKILITCRYDNGASRRTILAAGGVYERTTYYEVKDVYLERYWITL
jgi:predicted acetyltransferase